MPTEAPEYSTKARVAQTVRSLALFHPARLPVDSANAHAGVVPGRFVALDLERCPPPQLSCTVVP
jgi:hypothetical protein